jgi:phosphoglycolate phosphatase-like HAD superfamily hydrolase
MQQKIIIWDNDGTIMGSKDPNDTGSSSKVILPNVKKTMNEAKFNAICSGCRTDESEKQNFDPSKVIEKFKRLMGELPIQLVTFSPTIGGIHCYAIIRERETKDFEIRVAHEQKRYSKFIGQFKKPGIGMLVVIKDILKEDFGIDLSAIESIMIGDTWHDEAAAKDFGIAFLNASHIHNLT